MNSKQLLRRLDELGRYSGETVRVRKARRKVGSVAWVMVRTVLLAGLSFVLLYPVLYMFSMAFRPVDEVLDAAVIWVPKTFTLNIISHAMELMEYGKSVLQTIRISVVSSLVQLATACLAGYGFARFRFKGKPLLFALLILTIVIPPQTTIIPLYLQNQFFDFLFLGNFGRLLGGQVWTVNLIDTAWSLYLPAFFANGIRSGLIIYIFRQFFSGMPKELEDAAYIDGAGPVSTFLRVMAPNAGVAFLTVFLFSIVWYWNDYYYASMFLVYENTLAIKLSRMTMALIVEFGNNYFISIPYLQAGCLLTIAPVLAVYLIFQRYFTESIERTGIVG
jgi:multiple sugar transport system permease protein